MGEMGEMGSDRRDCPRWLEFLMDGVLAGKGTSPREKSIYDVT